jgi:hypothetical protein
MSSGAQNMEHLAGLAKQLLASVEAFKIKGDVFSKALM